MAILRKGRLAASGSTADLTAGHTHGWEVTASGLTPAAVTALQASCLRATRIAHGRYTFALGADQRPEPLVADVAARGGRLEGVTPLRATLEDVFLERVS